MNHRATGTFDVSLTPQSEPDDSPGAALGRMALSKQYSGDLVAVGQGEMLTAMTKTEGSAAYVAIERVTGALHGRAGSFVFQHTGTMDRSAQSLAISIVPDSGTGELVGLSGRFTLSIVNGKHFYDFEYTLPQGQTV